MNIFLANFDIFADSEHGCRRQVRAELCTCFQQKIRKFSGLLIDSINQYDYKSNIRQDLK